MQRFRNLLLIGTALMPLAATSAMAGPVGGTVVGGSATINNPGSANVTVNQFSDKAIINWRMFDIGVGEKTTFSQPNSNSIVLNRVTGGMGPSQILGSLEANGKVFVVNRDGIIFGAGAVINTAGFLATTSDIKNEDFMAGRFNFQIPGRPDASIVNMGTITAASGGFAALVAPGVRNSGTITAKLGTVALGAGNLFNLDFYGDRLIQLGVGDQIATQVRDVATGQTLKSLITNEGKLKANGGRVELTAAAARHVVDSVINTSGVIEANSVGTRNGQIVLSAATAATKGVDAPQNVRVSGTLSAAGKRKGTKGGSILVTGENIEVAGATIDASGREGGGKVLIGGDWGGGKPDKSLVSNQSAQLEANAIPTATTVSVDAATRIDASAKERGDGGKVILWADDRMSFAGTILALGGTQFGNGGFAEVSGHNTLNITGHADLRATNGNAGTLLLDPNDGYIDPVGGPTRPAGATVFTNIFVQDQLALGNFVLATNGASFAGQVGDIFVNAPVAWSANTLTLSAFKDVRLPDITNANLVGSGTANLIMRADNTGTGTGTIVMPASTFQNRVNWTASTGTVTVYYNDPNYGSPRDFTGLAVNGRFNLASPSQLTAYMLVNTTAQLGSLSTNLNGAYAIGPASLNATGFAGFAPGTTFNGILTGNGGLGTNSTITNLSGRGLFPFIGTAGKVRDLDFTNVNITANANSQFIGPVAGQNDGTITNVRVLSGTVSGGTFTGILAGGLVGQNTGNLSIHNSSSAASVSVGNGTTGPGGGNSAGGLVASNSGTIANSSASGAVSGGANSFIGGLVGQNNSTITTTAASGNVSGAGVVGGLVGFNSNNASIANGAATGNVSGSASNATVGGLVGQNEGLIAGSARNGGTISGDGAGGQNAILGGLVGSNNSSGIVRTSAVTNTTVTGNIATAGGLVGVNSGQVGGTAADQVTVSGVTLTLNGANSIGGGIVGSNSATGVVGNAIASGTISRTVGAAANTFMTFGGLVGRNSGSVHTSSASTVVNGGAGSAGGLVGQNEGVIASSSASGNVSGTGVLATSAYIGGLVGSNNSTGQITASTASGAVLTGGFAHAGGLIGDNSASLSNLSASNPVTATGNGAVIGGLIGSNNLGATITNSRANGNVTSSFNATGPFDLTTAGGLVGTNMGTITGSSQPNAGTSCAAGASCATGAVSVGSKGAGGGLAGINLGAIVNSFATGAVTGAAGLGEHDRTNLGGLAGFNAGPAGTITGSHARGNVGGNVAQLSAGGLAGDNTGAISNSFAAGNVTVGNNSQVGGLVGSNGNDCPGCSGAIINASASGNVTAGTGSFAGGLAGGTGDTESFTNTSASGAVTAGANSVIGGLIGALGGGTVSNSQSTGPVTGTGANVMAGGLVGLSFGKILSSTATGAVGVATDSYAGGLVGGNLGRVENSNATAAATMTGGSSSVVGGLAGLNAGTITQSNAANAVTTGAFGAAGGLVGANVVFEGVPPGPGIPGSSFPSGTIVSSTSTGAVTGGFGTKLGGLIGINGGSISGLSSSATVSGGGGSTVGGLVGMNGGPSGGPSFPAVLTGCSGCGFAGVSISSGPGSIANSTASGNVSGGSGSTVGGLVGSNPGTITGSTSTVALNVPGALYLGGLVGQNESGGSIVNSSASGAVTGGAITVAGGLVGSNDFGGSISGSSATGTVNGGLMAGGLVGINNGAISISNSSGAVTGGLASTAGGLVGFNLGSINDSHASGNVTGGEGSTLGGLVGMNAGTVTNSFGTGAVIADPSTAGGLAGINIGTITGSWASGAVSGDAGSMIGGLVGFNLLGTIQNSFSVSKVTVGDGGIAGGLVAINLGAINQSFATGAVTGGAGSYVGGLVAYNVGDGGVSGLPIGTISQSYATGAVTGGAASVVGGLVAENAGSLDQTYAAGRVIGGPGSITGGLVASNNFTVPGGTSSFSSASALPPGTSGAPGSATNSYWDTQTTGQSRSAGGTGQTTAQLAGVLPSGFSTPAWSSGAGLYPYLTGQPDPLPVPGPPVPVDPHPPTPHPPIPEPPTPPQPNNPTVVPQVSPLLNITATLVNETFSEKKPDDVIKTSNNATGPSGGNSPGGQKGGGQSGGPGGARPPAFGPAPFGLGPLPSGMPPLTETRFLSNEVVMQLGGRISAEELAALARKLGLVITYRETIALLGRTVIRFRITSGMAVRDVIAAVEKALGANFSMQPSYAFDLVQDVAQSGAAPADTSRKGDSAQYIVEKLGLVEAHLIATGKNIKVAVIDSEIDSKHPDLEGVVAGSYDALPSDDQTPHPHGTGMAGAIASHKRLLGVAPGAQLLAVRAFGVNTGGAQGTSLNIVKGLQWAVDQGAKVINMSFAGPRDPILQQAMKRLTDQGIILIAAAGNAGPKSPPLYPAADHPNVIAVSATDVDDKIYKGANRGKHVAIAAPGVDILVPAPEGGYQLTTGTSVAAAHISGVVALLLERDGSLRPETVRAILSSTAKNVGAPRNDLGSGLVDPVKALSKVGPKSAQLR